MHSRIALAMSLSIALVVAGCGDDGSDSGGTGASVDVVATSTQVADFVRNVGGERVNVHQILEANSDPHAYEARPSDAKAVAGARAIFLSGGDVDEWMDGLIDSAGSDAPQITLIEQVQTREGGHDHEHPEDEHAEEEQADDEHAGDEHAEEEHAEEEHADEEHSDEVDPHWWQDPHNVEQAVPAIRDVLIRIDPQGRAAYDRNADRYLAKLERLDREVASCLSKLPASRRKLVTTHDALGYYAERYDLEVLGAVIPSLSTQSQPSAKDVNELVEQIRDNGVKAIFPESSLNPRLERAVARESGAMTGGALWADSLGPEGSSGETYIGSIAANTKAIAQGLSGGTISCRFTA